MSYICRTGHWGHLDVSLVAQLCFLSDALVYIFNDFKCIFYLCCDISRSKNYYAFDTISMAVTLSKTLECTMASKTCRYCSQLVVTPNRGTLIIVKGACRGVYTTCGTPGVLNNRFSARISAKSCCIRATVSTNKFSGNQASFRRSEPTSIVRTSVKIWGTTRVPPGGNWGSEACWAPGPRSVSSPPRWHNHFRLLHDLPIQWQQRGRSAMMFHTPVASMSKTPVRSGTTGGRPPPPPYSTSGEPPKEAPSWVAIRPIEWPMPLAHHWYPPRRIRLISALPVWK